MRGVLYRTSAVVLGVAILWLMLRVAIRFLPTQGGGDVSMLSRIAGSGICVAPILGFIIVELITGRVIWWPYEMTRRRDDPWEYWFSILLQALLVAGIVGYCIVGGL